MIISVRRRVEPTTAASRRGLALHPHHLGRRMPLTYRHRTDQSSHARTHARTAPRQARLSAAHARKTRSSGGGSSGGGRSSSSSSSLGSMGSVGSMQRWRSATWVGGRASHRSLTTRTHRSPAGRSKSPPPHQPHPLPLPTPPPLATTRSRTLTPAVSCHVSRQMRLTSCLRRPMSSLLPGRRARNRRRCRRRVRSTGLDLARRLPRVTR
jgi:hypothetical protein